MVLAACISCGGETEDVRLSVPDFGTSHVLFGTAAAGRSIPPSSLRVVPQGELQTLMPEVIGGTEIDMLVAGIDAPDLPIGLAPEDIKFVTERETNARPLPRLHAPHVLLRPSPAETPSILVAIDADSAKKDGREERRARSDRLLENLAIAAPCQPPPAPIQVTTPRTSAETIRVLQPLSTQETVVGFSITSTLMFGLLPAGGGEMRFVAIPTVEEIVRPGEETEMRWISTEEVQVRGRPLPAAFTFDIINGFGSSGVHMAWDPTAQRYREDTPGTERTAPRELGGMVKLDLDGTPSLCGFGTGLGMRAAMLWCRTETSTTWTVHIEQPLGFGVSNVVPRTSGAHLATDLAGTVYEYRGDRRWAAVLQSSINMECGSLCAAFSSAVTLRFGPSVAAIAGAKAQILLLQDTGPEVSALRPAALDQVLFWSERPQGDEPLRFSALAESPDGALWIADTHPRLFRISPDGAEVARICLPKAMAGAAVAAISAQADGRLLLGMSPALLAIGAWQ